MSAITVVEFETSPHGGVYLSELSDGPPFTVHGVALGADDVTVGQSGVKKLWPADELKEAAASLKGTNLVVDHENSADGVVGRVTKAGYKDGSGVIYEAELYDEELGQKVKNGLLEVSIRGFHADVDSLEENDDGAKVVEDIEFDNLSIVPTGASPSNSLEIGSHDELSAAELSAFTDSLESAELEEISAGDYVRWDGNHGITISLPEDGSIEVDKYEEDSDGMWRSVEQVVDVQLDDLSMWDVDEENVGQSMKEAEENRSVEENMLIKEGMTFFSTLNDKPLTITEVKGDIVRVKNPEGSSWREPIESVIDAIAEGEWEGDIPIESGMKFYSTVNNVMLMIADVSGDMVTVGDMEGDTWKESKENVITKVARGHWEPSYNMNGESGDPMEDSPSYDEEEMADPSYSRGDWVNWDTRNSTEIGKVTGSYQEGDDLPNFRGSRSMSPEGEEVLYALRMYKERDGSYHPITGKPIGHYEESVRSAEKPKNVSDMSVELGRSNVGQYDVEEEDWVQWYPSDTTEEHGFATAVDDDTVTIEVWTQDSDGKWETDGDTIEKEMDEVEPWGNFPREQDEFADAIEDGDPRKKPADNEYAEENAESEELVSAEVEEGLKNKVEEHNEEHGDEDGKKVTYSMLKDVYERGMGAYNDTHREGMTQQQWSYARVNAFLYLVRNGNPENDAYKQDNDLLPDGHPKKSEENAPVDPTDWKDGQLVEWQVYPDLMGKVVHDDEERDVVMVEIMTEEDGNLTSTGYTITAGYTDIRPYSMGEMEAEMSITSSDTPTQDAAPSHDTGVKSLLDRFMDSVRGEPTIEKFEAYIRSSEDLEIDRPEASERSLDSKPTLHDSRMGQPERFVDADDDTQSSLAKSYSDYPEAASENAQMALDAKEETENPNECGTDIGWKRARQLAEGKGISRAEVGKMSAFNRHRQNSEMDSDEGRADCGWMMWKAWGGDEGVDWAQDKLEEIDEENMAMMKEEHMFSSKEDAMEVAQEMDLDGVHEMDGMWMPGETHDEYMDAMSEMGGSMYGEDNMDEDEMARYLADEGVLSDVGELQDYDMEMPSYEGTTEADWSSPTLDEIMQAYGWDEEYDSYDALPEDAKETIGNHFMISMSGFPAENFGDYKLPVVEPSGELSLNALAAVKGGRGVSAVDGLNAEMEDEIVAVVNDLAQEEFDKDWGEEEMAATTGRPTPGENTVGGVRVLSGDDLWDASKSKESDLDSIAELNVITMTENIEEKLSELDEPVAVEAGEVESLREKADRFEEMSSSLEALRERTDILDEVDRSDVEALAEAEDAIVVESGRFAELKEEAEQVKGMYADELAEEYPAFTAEELADKFSIEELREKFEEQIGEVDELAESGDAATKSQDPSEESLEEASTGAQSEESLSDEVSQKQEELRNKILGGN